jgi:tagatose-1,6-bisphosphate aldolase non-catalytic subunit AgaZ/GatZ
MQTENYYASQIKPDRVPRKYSYMNRARKYNRKAWLAEKRDQQWLAIKYENFRDHYDRRADFWYEWT